MSESKHTPEPWVFGYGQTREFGMCLGIGLNSAPDWHVVAVVSPADSVNHADEANARRIVACVNACAGIPTYQLTTENDNPTNLGEVIDAIRKQRDELLKALENTHNALKHFWPEGHADAIAAIASVKGEQ